MKYSNLLNQPTVTNTYISTRFTYLGFLLAHFPFILFKQSPIFKLKIGGRIDYDLIPPMMNLQLVIYWRGKT